MQKKKNEDSVFSPDLHKKSRKIRKASHSWKLALSTFPVIYIQNMYFVCFFLKEFS